jgi:two-component system OmpR family sensor kinase
VSLGDRLSTSARVALAVTIVLAVGVTALSAVSYVSVRQRLRADMDRSLLLETEAFATAMRAAGTADPAYDLRMAARSYLETRSVDFTISHPVLVVRMASGRVLSNSAVLIDRAPDNAQALDAAVAHRGFLDFAYAGEDYRAAVVPVIDATGTIVAVFEAALPLGPTTDLANQVLRILALTSVVVVLAGALVSLSAARTSLSRLRAAAATADRVTQARLAERVAYAGPDDEVGSLVSAVNAMLDRLESAFGEQRRFLADASHELRTPLAIVSGHLEILSREDMEPDERVEELAIVSDEVARMGRLVDDMLALARLEAEASRPMQPLDVRSLLAEAAGRGRGLGDRRFVVDAHEGLWVYGEPDQLMQALLNLLKNAVAHSAEGSRITLTAAPDGDDVRISVEDNGPGMRPGDTERVFDRFFRTHGPRVGGGGSGLGLAIVKRLVELHGGTVTAGNRPTGGAIFTIRLPRTPAPAQA